MSKIKLYFLTGFLGSGKTTILRNLLENMEGTKVGVIQNELGKIKVLMEPCFRIMIFRW
ncbi:MAG: GTP-binding protein [Coprococcus comes]